MFVLSAAMFMAFIAVSMIPPVTEAAAGDTFTVDSVEYQVLADTSTVSVESYNVATGGEDFVIPSTVTYSASTYDVVSIEANAFLNSTIKTAVVGENVTSIGDNAFKGCTALYKITLLDTGSSDIRGTDSFATGNASGTAILYSGTYAYPVTESNGSGINHYYSIVKPGYHAVIFDDRRATVEMVEQYHSILLPEPAEWSGYTFEGWYSDKACTKYVGPAYGVYTPKTSTTLYALYSQLNSYTITATYRLDNVETTSDVIEGLCTTFSIPSTVTEGSIAHISIVPNGNYEFFVSSTDAFINAYSGGVYSLEPRHGVIRVALSVECWTLHQGIGEYRISSMTDEGRGAVVMLKASSPAGLMEGALHFGGVYAKVFAEDTISEVKAYGAIKDEGMDVLSDLSIFSPLTGSGIHVVSGDSLVSSNVRLHDSGAEIFSIYAIYKYSSNAVATSLQYGCLGILNGGI